MEKHDGATRKVGYLCDTLFFWHDTGTGGDEPSDPRKGLQPVNRHYSAPEPKKRLHELIQVSRLRDQIVDLRARPATDEEILRAHSAEHLKNMEMQSQLPKGGDCGDGGSPFGHNAIDIARLSAGGAIVAMESVLSGDTDCAYALINPPGHHAERDRSLGFCLFNNASIAVAHAKEKWGLERVAIVDWDVHHGNGSQDIWWTDPSVLTISIHQDRNFPVDSGFVDERGGGEGLGHNFNIPLPPGSGNIVYEHVVENLVRPALEQFQPDLILVSCGYDAAMQDPLGRMMVTTSGFKRMTALMIETANKVCDGRLVFVQEGGYCQYYVPFCGLATMEELVGADSGFSDGYAAIVEGQIRTEITAEQQAAIQSAHDAHFSSDESGGKVG